MIVDDLLTVAGELGLLLVSIVLFFALIFIFWAFMAFFFIAVEAARKELRKHRG